MVSPAKLLVTVRPVFHQPVEARFRPLPVAVGPRDRIHLHIPPPHISHALGRGVRSDAYPRSDMERRPQNGRGQKSPQKVNIESEIPKKRQVAVPGIEGSIIVGLDPLRDAVDTSLHCLSHILTRHAAPSTHWTAAARASRTFSFRPSRTAAHATLPNGRDTAAVSWDSLRSNQASELANLDCSSQITCSHRR